jgi:hypothetical protein
MLYEFAPHSSHARCCITFLGIHSLHIVTWLDRLLDIYRKSTAHPRLSKAGLPYRLGPSQAGTNSNKTSRKERLRADIPNPRFSRFYAAVVDFVGVGSMTGIPPRRCFRHTGRDSSGPFPRMFWMTECRTMFELQIILQWRRNWARLSMV